MSLFLEARNIVKQFGSYRALADVSLSVPTGRIFGLLGPNGAGKTTLIRIFNHITAPDSGSVLFDGRPLTADDTRRIGYLPEERGLYKKMKVGEQAVYLARLKGLSKAEATRRLKQWFGHFGIMPWWNKKLEELSKGMQQKVQFIITVVHRPPLLIFDEPFSGFDPVNAELLKREILDLRRRGHTIIFSTHNMASVEEICDEIALLNHGHVVLSGRVDEIKRAHRTGRYRVMTDGTLLNPAPNAPYRILQHEGTEYVVEKDPALTNNDLLALLTKEAELRTFEEAIPSMNDIFIKTVGETEADASAQPDTPKSAPEP